MARKDWTVDYRRASRSRVPRIDPTLRLMLVGEQIARWGAGVALIAVTAVVCAIAVLGPEVLVVPRGDGFAHMITQIRQAFSALVAVFV